jgi:hypothetical protein
MGRRATTVTRVSAALSVVAPVAAALSDFLLTGFWDRNAMVTSVVADVLVLVVGVAVVNEFVAARARREWRLLADYGLVELGEGDRHTWVMLAEHIGVGKREADAPRAPRARPRRGGRPDDPRARARDRRRYLKPPGVARACRRPRRERPRSAR